MKATLLSIMVALAVAAYYVFIVMDSPVWFTLSFTAVGFFMYCYIAEKRNW